MRRSGRARGIRFDPRLVIGLTLVAASVAGTVTLFAAVDDAVPLLAAKTALLPGDRITAADLRPHPVRLGALEAAYLGVADLPEEGAIVARAVGAGELVPRDAIGSTNGERLAAVVVPIADQLGRGVTAGSAVDVWAAQAVEATLYAPPTVIVAAATVVGVRGEDDLVSAGQRTHVEVLVPRAAVARLLEAVANQDALSLVPVSLPIGE